jgi:hypothetical protein
MNLLRVMILAIMQGRAELLPISIEEVRDDSLEGVESVLTNLASALEDWFLGKENKDHDRFWTYSHP